jgi:hypothetical protein
VPDVSRAARDAEHGLHRQRAAKHSQEAAHRAGSASAAVRNCTSRCTSRPGYFTAVRRATPITLAQSRWHAPNASLTNTSA